MTAAPWVRTIMQMLSHEAFPVIRTRQGPGVVFLNLPAGMPNRNCQDAGRSIQGGGNAAFLRL